MKSIYVLSDIHLGAPNPAASLPREKHLVQFLEEIAPDCEELFLLGDLFDFWFEYRQSVPRGFVRFMGQLARMADQGIPIHVFTGNHDLWHQNYLEEQIGIQLYREPQLRAFFGRSYFFAHGDGLGPGDHGYKLMKKIVTHPLSRWLFARLHPNFGIGLALWISQNGGDHDYEADRLTGYQYDHLKDPLWIFAHEQIEQGCPADCYVFGHRHQLVDEALPDQKRFVILGDWIHFFSYLKITPQGQQLLRYPLTTQASVS